MKKLLELFVIFFKIGLFTIGGGYAMIPQIQDEIVNKKKWIEDEEMLQIITISETTPGPIAINVATYIGYKQKGFLGSLFSTLGVILPSLIIITIVSYFFMQFIENKYVAYAFYGINLAVAILIIKAGINLLIKIERKPLVIIVFIISSILLILFELFNINFSSIYFILIGGIGNMIITLINTKKVNVQWYIYVYFLNSLKLDYLPLVEDTPWYL